MTDILSDAERVARVRLCRSETIGPITFYRLLSRFGSAVKALEALPHMATKAGRAKPLYIYNDSQARTEIAKVENFGGIVIVYGDPEYPKMLAATEDAPPVLSVLGDVDLLSKPSIAIVGARNASANGRRLTQKLATELGAQAYVIASGLARGIDTSAHEASLATGTIAVLAGGIDQIYPSENAKLYQQIADQGCVVSEMPFGVAPIAHHFPRRNRIVSGLSLGTVVVEASLRSGSLITARLAAEQGREVFAVPGFPGDPRSAGPNNLIQNGAKLVTRADDIVQELTTFNLITKPQQQSFKGIAEDFTPFEMTDDHAEMPDNLHDALLENMAHTPLEVDELARSCQFSIQMVQTALLELELAGQIERHPGNRVSRAA